MFGGRFSSPHLFPLESELDMSTILLEPVLDIIEDIREEVEFDEPTVSHLITKEDALNGYINGVPITAVCGHVFVPTRDPDKFPLCQKCVDVAKNMFYNGEDV
jgi:hypothetical protein